MPRLIVKLPGGPKTVPVGDEAVSIGRTPENTLPLDVEGVSRRHAQILFVGKGYEVVDMGSRNGTKVNGQKVPRAILKPGDVIHIGGVDMVFEDGAAAGAAGAAGGAAASDGLDIEELDLGGGPSSSPSASSGAVTAAIPASGGGATGECVLRIVDGEKKGTEVPLKAARTTFGRRSGNTVTFTDSGVSGVHCEITREANGYVLRDLGSTNGTLVDGEPVVELLLRHNSRIRVGANRILFVDPTVADIESSLAAADDGSEWGLMRGEIDVTASRGRGGRGALAAAVVLALAGGGAWWVTSNRPAHEEVALVKDNRITDFSFEEDAVLWFSPTEGGPGARIVGTPEARRGASGIHALEVLSQPEGLARVQFNGAAQGGADNSVAPDTAYEISAKVGSGSGAIVVVWVSSSRPDLVREVSTPVVEGGSPWKETKAIVTAPPHATAARIQLCAFGGRPAMFDDVVFRPAGSGAAEDLVAQELHVRIDAGGFLEAVRGGEILLTQGGVAPAVDTPVEALLGATLAGPPAHSGAAVSASGTAFGGGAFETKAESAGGGAATLTCAPKGGAGAFTFTCPAGMANGAVTLVLAKAAAVLPDDETYKREGVVKIIVGTSDGPQPFVLSADPASAGFTFTSLRTPRGLRIQLAPAAGASAAVLLSVDLSRETEAANALAQKAKGFEADGKLGQAAEAFAQVALAFHYLPDFRKPAEENAARITAKGKAELEAGKSAARDGKQFGSAPDLERALGILQPLITSFGGHVFGTQAEEQRVAVEADLKKVRATAVLERAERLYSRAADFAESAQPALQLPLLEEIVRITPEDNDFHKQAMEKIQGVRTKVEEERARLYGPPKR